MTDSLTASQIHDRIAACRSDAEYLKKMAKRYEQKHPSIARDFLKKLEQVQRELAALAQSAEAR